MSDPAKIALDIETISPQLGPHQKPNFENPEHFELLIVGLGYQSERGEIEELTALFRNDPTPDAELELVKDVVAWIQDHPADQVITYNGTRFDLTHLEGRPRIIEDGTGPVTTELLAMVDELDHLDLKPAAWRRYGDYTSLEKVCRSEGLTVEETRFGDFDHGMKLDAVLNRGVSDSSIVKSGDVPALGERWLAASAGENPEQLDIEGTRQMLEHYALADIKPLFRLADAHPFSV